MERSTNKDRHDNIYHDNMRYAIPHDIYGDYDIDNDDNNNGRKSSPSPSEMQLSRDRLSSFAPSESDCSTLIDIKKRVQELDGMLNDLDSTRGNNNNNNNYDKDYPILDSENSNEAQILTSNGDDYYGGDDNGSVSDYIYGDDDNNNSDCDQNYAYNDENDSTSDQLLYWKMTYNPQDHLEHQQDQAEDNDDNENDGDEQQHEKEHCDVKVPSQNMLNFRYHQEQFPRGNEDIRIMAALIAAAEADLGGGDSPAAAAAAVGENGEGILLRDNTDVYSEFSERTDDWAQRERSQQLLRQELDAVDMVHSVSGMYWKKHVPSSSPHSTTHEEELALKLERYRNILKGIIGTNNKINSDAIVDIEHQQEQGQNDDLSHPHLQLIDQFQDAISVAGVETRASSNATTSAAASEAGKRRNRRILMAQILCAIITVFMVTGLVLVILHLESTAKNGNGIFGGAGGDNNDDTVGGMGNKNEYYGTSSPSPSIGSSGNIFTRPTLSPVVSRPTFPKPPHGEMTAPTIPPATATKLPHTQPSTSQPTLSPVVVAPTTTTAQPMPTPTLAPVSKSPVELPTNAPVIISNPFSEAPTTATNDNNNNNNNSNTFPPVSNPTAINNRRNEMVEYLQQNYNVRFDEPMNSANWAVNWLLGETQTTPLDESFAQRFALVSLDYSLSGIASTSRLIHDLSWSTLHQNECLWAGVHCNLYDRVDELRWNGLQLFGFIPPEISILGNSLQYLDLSNNELIGSIPEELYDLTNLESIYLYENDLSGTLSSRLGNLSRLRTFHVNRNQLSGELPDTMQSMDKLRYLNLHRNHLTGSIPYTWRSMIKLFYLDLGHNHLTGPLPTSWNYRFDSLRHLHLDHNQFTGEIPLTFVSRLGNSQLETLSLDHNRLDGTIPSRNVATSRLVSYTLQENEFTIGLDPEICRMNIFDGGHVVEFHADCNICTCDNFFCDDCAGW